MSEKVKKKKEKKKKSHMHHIHTYIRSRLQSTYHQFNPGFSSVLVAFVSCGVVSEEEGREEEGREEEEMVVVE